MSDYCIYTDESYHAPCRALVLNYIHRTMDMSVAGGSQRAQLIIIPEKASFPIVSENYYDCGKTEILGLDSEDNLLLRWHKREYSLPKGEMLETETLGIDNPYLSREEVSMRYDYLDLDNVLDAVEYFYDDVRGRCSSLSRYAMDERDMALELLWHAIEKGNVGLYPSYALLKSCNNWASLTITDTDTFVSIMRQGIDSGCFAPHKEDGVYNLAALLEQNKTYDVFTLMPELKGIMESLAQGGNKLAAKIAAYGIECAEKISRRDPEKVTPVFIICKVDANGVEYSYNLLIGDEIKPCAVVDFDGTDALEILETSKESISFTWCGEKFRIDESSFNQRFTTDLSKSRLKLCFSYRNLWELLKEEVFQVSYSQTSNNPDEKHRIESLKKCVMKLVEWLIAEGDEKSVELREALETNEIWRCFVWDGELNHMLMR